MRLEAGLQPLSSSGERKYLPESSALGGAVRGHSGWEGLGECQRGLRRERVVLNTAEGRSQQLPSQP